MLREEPVRFGGAGVGEGRQCWVVANPVSLGMEAESTNRSATRFEPRPWRLFLPQLPAAGRLLLGTERVLVTLRAVPLACLLRPHSCLLLPLIPLLLFMTLRAMHNTAVSGLLFLSLPDNSRLGSEALPQRRRRLRASHPGPSSASAGL